MCIRDRRWRTNCTLFSFLKKWRLQMEMLMMGDTAVASAAPVSYTHLDVYKRQYRYSASRV